MTKIEKLDNTIMVLETMVFGKGFSRTEIESLNNAMQYLKDVKSLYEWLYSDEQKGV